LGIREGAAASSCRPFVCRPSFALGLSGGCGGRKLAAKPAVPAVWFWEIAKMNYLLVFIGGGLGSTLRYIVNVVCPRFLGADFPYHTFIINITGSTVMGLIAGYLAFKGDAAQSWRLFLMTGILGGYTTFSAFSLDTAVLYERGEIGLALFYVLGSVVFSIAGLFAGLTLVRHLA
jgi:fluoride exporter